MYKKIGLALAILALGGCRIVSQEELAELKSPPNPHMNNINKTWQEKIVPQVITLAYPAAELITALNSAKDFDSACEKLGYRAQAENPCIFYVKIEGKISHINDTSRSGKMTISEPNGSDITVQIGPTLRGTQLRDSYKNVSYADFNDQVLFGEFSREINQLAVQAIQSAPIKNGETVQVYGVFSAWDLPQTIPDVTPVKITSLGGQ